MSKASSLKNATLRFPALPNPPLYKSFIKSVERMPGNAKALATVEKVEVDDSYKIQLKKHLEHDEKALQRYMQDVTSKDAQSLWESVKTRYAPVVSPAMFSDAVRELNLPRVGQDHRNAAGKGSSMDSWSLQTYAEFAMKAEKRNSDVRFVRALMDSAFRYQVSKATPLAKGRRNGDFNPAKVETMLARCLGRESDKYWKAR